jgi:melanoma-associated antigen p97
MVCASVVGADVEDCMKRINAGTAQFAVFDGSFIDQAATTYNLRPIRTQASSEGQGSQYHAIAIVKKSACPKSLADLKGKRSCHTGYGRSAGWVLPMSTLLDANIMPVVSQ